MSQKTHKPYWVPVEDALKKIKNTEAKPRKILILGAGIAGLAAAYEIGKLKAGHEVHVVEASDRIGGRIWTHRFGDDPAEGEPDNRPYHEFGAMRIPEITHDYTWHYVKELDLSTRIFYNTNKTYPGNFDLRDQQFKSRAPYTEFLELFPNLTEEEKRVVQDKDGGVNALLGKYLNPVRNNLIEKGLVRDLVYGNMTSSYLKWIDRYSVRSFFLELVENWEMSNEALELIGTSLSLESLWSWSLAEFIRGTFTNSPPEDKNLFEIIDGFDKLPKGLCKKIKQLDQVRIQKEAEVIAIKLHETGAVTVIIKDHIKEEIQELNYDQVLCTLPFPVMRLMKLEGLSQEKIRSIRNMEYSSSTKVLLCCSDRFWEKEQDPIFGGRSISDRLSRQTYYPSDFQENKPKRPDKKGFQLRDLDTSSPFWSVHSHSSTSPEIVSKRLEEDGEKKGVILGSYSWTDNSRQIGKLKGEGNSCLNGEPHKQELSERAEHVLNDLEHIHPSIRKYVEASASMFWDEYPWAKGAFAATPPGDLTYYFQNGKKAEGNLFFAGEHVSIAPGWIQGALESSLAAVAEMLEQKK